MEIPKFGRLPLILILAALAIPASAQRIFFADRDPISAGGAKPHNPPDYMQLFSPEAPWAQGAKKVDIFSISTQFALSGTDEQLRTVFADMKRRHIKMGIEMGTVIRLDTCGLGEGYAPPGMAATVGKRLSRLGFELDYLIGDEAVTFTHSKTEGTAKDGHPNCVYPIPVVVERTVMTINALREYFPALQYGIDEVAALDPKLTPQKRLADYIQFARGIEAKTGKKLAFFHADVAWRTDPLSVIAPMRAAFKAEHIPFGVIIGGSPKDTTDLAFEQDGLSRLDLLMRNPATRLDDVIIQSWQPLPSHVLPETTPGTSTNILLRAERLLAHDAEAQDAPGQAH